MEAVLFDLDGTLVDTAPDFIRILNALRQTQGKPALENAVIRAAVSAGARAMIQVGFPEHAVDSPEFIQLRQQFLDNYGLGLDQESRLFDGLETLLSQLEQRGIPWGIVTNKPRVYSEALLKGLHLDQRCAVLVCPDDVSRTKPDPEPLYLACKKLGVTTENSVYVGDHIRDIQAGNNANMTTIAVGFGYIVAGEHIEDWQADHCVQTVAELIHFFNS
ncbi:HAD family hydrolase [Agitococcus lubricus]|uniref:HAD family hydrolase n=1 Tax=Agitococcus lubricus TaxID=1077255 RepID=UPI000D2F847F